MSRLSRTVNRLRDWMKNNLEHFHSKISNDLMDVLISLIFLYFLSTTHPEMNTARPATKFRFSRTQKKWSTEQTSSKHRPEKKKVLADVEPTLRAYQIIILNDSRLLLFMLSLWKGEKIDCARLFFLFFLHTTPAEEEHGLLEVESAQSRFRGENVRRKQG